jgi:ABC-type glycerol-3-phosphate transport system substrate-binding protein
MTGGRPLVNAGAVSYNPLYLQVKDVLLRRIVDGSYGPGESLPSESQLSNDFGTSISTIRQALSILVSEGYLVKKQGKGTFVSERKTEITFHSWIMESSPGARILSNLIHRFEEANPTIRVRLLETTYPESRTDLVKLISNGEAPDVAQIVSHWTSFFASMGAFEPLDDLLQSRNLAGRDREKDLLGGMYQNRIYSVSWGLCPVSLIVNSSVLRRIGVEKLQTCITLEEFARICKRASALPDGTTCGYGLCISGEESDFLRIYTFLQAFHGGFVNESGEVVFDSRENVEGFSWLRDFVSATRVCVTDIYTLRRRFANGEIAFISDGPWIRYLLEDITGEEFARSFQVILNPMHRDPVSYSWNYNHALAICSQSKNKIYAAKLIDELTIGEELSDYYYASVGHLPVTGALLNGAPCDDSCIGAFREQLKHSTVINAQNSMFEKAMVLCIDAVKKILFEGADIERELREKQYYLKMLYYG